MTDRTKRSAERAQQDAIRDAAQQGAESANLTQKLKAALGEQAFQILAMAAQNETLQAQNASLRAAMDKDEPEPPALKIVDPAG